MNPQPLDTTTLGQQSPVMSPPIESIPLQLQVGIQQGPDGRPWIMYEWAVGLNRMAMLVPVGTAKQLPQLVADMTAQTLAQMPATSGLILPPTAGAGFVVPAR